MSTSGSSELSSSPPSPTQAISTSPVSFDPKFYPHLFDIILAQLNIEELILLRGMCHFARDKVDQKLSAHVVMATVKNRVVACLPTSPPRPVPKTNFWRTNLKKSTRIVDYPRQQVRASAYPKTLSNLNVDTIRTYGCPPLGTPTPTTREWISFLNEGLEVGEVYNKVATDQITMVLNGRPGEAWTLMLDDAGPVKVVVIVNGDWWTVNHDEDECPCGGRCWGWAPCYGDCDDCMEARGQAADFLQQLVEVVALQILNDPLPEQPTFTLVGMDRWIKNAWVFFGRYTKEEGRNGFVKCVEAYLREEGEEMEATNHIVFMTRKEYRDSVGGDRFKLQTRAGYGVN